MHTVPAWGQREVEESREAPEASSQREESPPCACWTFSGPARLPPALLLLD